MKNRYWRDIALEDSTLHQITLKIQHSSKVKLSETARGFPVIKLLS
jgi:hypothetical protein